MVDKDSGDEINFVVDSEGIDNPDDAREIDFELLSEFEDAADGSSVDVGSGNLASQATSAALTPGRPLYLMQRSHQHFSVLPAVCSAIRANYSGVISTGAVVPMPRLKQRQITDFFDSVGDVPVKIADPEGFARMDSFGPVLRAQRDDKPYVGPSTESLWPYLTAPLPDGPTQIWVKDLVTTQRDAGATLLLTPGLWLDPAIPTKALESMRQQADWTRDALEAGEQMAVNITAPAAWLSNSSLLEKLLNEVVDMNDETFYIRVRWPLLQNPYGQLLDSSILFGYEELSRIFEENDKFLILPNTSLTGWLSLAWGTGGFSTGLGTGERSFADTRVIKIRATQTRPEPTKRIYESSLLHVVESNVVDRIQALNEFDACGCVFCENLRRLPSGQFDKAQAGAHYLLEVARLTADVASSSSGALSRVREIVEAGLAGRRRIVQDVPLTGANDPKHLAVWSQLLH
jgi:hypothetical protein